MGVVEKARNTDPATSWEAAENADLAGSQVCVLNALFWGAMTHSELCRWHRTHDPEPYSDSRLRTATHELVEKGRVVADGTKINGRGRHEKIWRLA
jgi:hypothetical protein